MNRKQLIFASSLAIAMVILGVIGIIVGINKSSPSNTSTSPAGTVITDPVSGEKITQDSSLSQSNQVSNTPNAPVIIGADKLVDYGLTDAQQSGVMGDLTQFALTQKPAIKQLSFYQNSYTQQIDQTSGATTLHFKMQADQKTNYNTTVTYTGFNSAVSVSVTPVGQTTPIFSK